MWTKYMSVLEHDSTLETKLDVVSKLLTNRRCIQVQT
jgi:hypothetical protein